MNVHIKVQCSNVTRFAPILLRTLIYQTSFFIIIIIVNLSAKTSLMLGVHKAGFRREGLLFFFIYKTIFLNKVDVWGRVQNPPWDSNSFS